MKDACSLVDRLGGAELAELVRVEAVLALTNACDEASAAARSSRYSDGFTYGTSRWRFGLGWVADTLSIMAVGEVIKFGHLRLALIGSQPGCLLYPIAVGETAKLNPKALQIKPSKLRQALFGPVEQAHQLPFDFDGLHTTGTGVGIDDECLASGAGWPGSAQDPMVPDGPADDLAPDLEEAGEAELEDAELGDADVSEARSAGRAVLLLAYTSNPENGLLTVVIGEAVMAEDGTLTFLWHEQLKGRGDGGGGLRVVDVPKPNGPDFTTGAEPDLVTPPRRTSQPAVEGAYGTAGLAGGPAGAPADEAR